MIMTVTLNPAVDKTIALDHLHIGKLNKVNQMTLDAGGKGINVSKVIQSLGGQSLAMGILAGQAGKMIDQTLEKMAIQTHFSWIEGETRTNTKLFDPETQVTTEVNERGPEVTEAVLDQVLERIKAHIELPCQVILSGSVPPSLPRNTYQKMIKAIKALGANVFLDADGELFRQGIKSLPTWIKPNREELENYFGKAIETDQELIEAGKHFVNQGVEEVFITLGGQGALYVSRDDVYQMEPLKVSVNSTVGAGDAFVGGLVYGKEKGLSKIECLQLAIATSAGAAMTVGTKPMDQKWVMSHMAHVKVTQL